METGDEPLFDERQYPYSIQKEEDGSHVLSVWVPINHLQAHRIAANGIDICFNASTTGTLAILQ